MTSLNIDSTLVMQAEMVDRWHKEPISNPHETAGENLSFLAIACQQHQFNYLLWHEEDIARSPDVSDATIAKVKRAIDGYNQRRNDWIEKLDDWITNDLEKQGIQPSEKAKLATETPGSAIDRLSIISLRIYHLEEQLDRSDIDESHAEKVRHRLAICKLQRDELSNSLRELLQGIYGGVQLHRTYRQFKMYNDPTLNPYLYDRSLAQQSK